MERFSSRRRPWPVLIERYGRPVFCKIDVEGYEAEVLRGLSQPVRALAIEFTAENFDGSREALGRLAELGEYRFDFSEGESLRLALGWVSAEELVAHLSERVRAEPLVWGDIYARLTNTRG